MGDKTIMKAIKQAREDVPELVGHSHSCEYCILED